MQNESSPDDQMREFDAMELEIVYLLTDMNRHPPIWSVMDIGRALGTDDPDAVVRPLRNAGLVHRTTDDFVFATPAAYRMVELAGHVA
jgi:hypothetical protein